MSLPLQFSIQNNQVSLVVLGILVFIFSFSLVYWALSRSKSYLQIFDVVVVLLFSALLFSRILAVILNFSSYAVDPVTILNLFDKNFIYTGIFLGLILGALIINKTSAEEKDLHPLMDKIVVSYATAVIPLLLLVMLSGKMVGIGVSGGIGLIYADGTQHMPVNLFRISYDLLFLVCWLLLRKHNGNKGMFAAIYLMLFGAIEFILRIFSLGYAATIFNIVDLQQAVSVLILLLGVVLLLDANNINLIRPKNPAASEALLTRKYLDRSFPRSEPVAPRERFSLSYSSIQDSVNKNELTLKEKLTIFGNTLKRRIKK